MTAEPLIHVAGLDAETDQRAFNSWFVREHLPRTLERPGWLGARCFECLKGEPELLTIYELDGAVAGRRISAAPFRSGVAERRGIRDYHARTYRQVHEAGNHADRPELVNVVTVDIEPEHADMFNRWYNEVHFPEILACPGWRGGRRYESIDGDPRFLAIYDLEDATRPFSTPEYEAAVGWDDYVDHIRGYHGFRIYRLIHDSHAL
jgi:hypothetical protein